MTTKKTTAKITTLNEDEMLRQVMSRLGRSRSPAKLRAARANAQFAGRKRIYPPCPRKGYGGRHRFNSKTGVCPCGFKRPRGKKPKAGWKKEK